MRITIKTLSLQNFKCFKDYTIVFNPQVTNVAGDNGTGKTTIADAISWCLFGKDTQNRSQFDIKYHDSYGNTIPKTSVMVALTIDCDGVEHTIIRKLKEKWQTKRGDTTEEFKGNYTEYFVNGNMMSQGEFSAFISKLINENVFRAITNPTYFLAQKWQDQRAFLSQMVGHIGNEEIAGSDDRFTELLSILEQEDITLHLKHIGYKINEIKKKLEEIPIRLGELNKAMPQLVHTENEVTGLIANLSSKMSETESKINAIKQGNASSVIKDELNKKLDFANRRKREMERSANNQETLERESFRKAKEELDARRAKLDSLIFNLKKQIDTDNAVIDQSQKSIEYDEKLKQELKKEWNEKVNIKINPKITDNDKICPICGQELPEEKLTERINQIKEKAERKRLETKDYLLLNIRVANNKIDLANKTIIEARADIAAKEKQIAEKEEELTSLDKVIVRQPKTYEELLAENPNYQKVLDEINKLEGKLETSDISEDDCEKINELTQQYEAYQEELNKTHAELAKFEQSKKVQKLIDDANNDQKTLAEQLASLQRDEDLAKEFSDKADNLLEEKVNKHFQIVRWKMFRQMINGNKESYCECYVDGTAYHDTLNSAAKLNAGLDIIRTLCKLYQANAPIVIDNAESTNDILDTDSQQIRLYVSNDISLTIK